MLNYELIGSNDYIFDPQGTILENRGIDNPEKFLNLTDDVVHDYRLLKNIDKAVECLLNHIEKKSNILIVTDPDVDGYTSSAILYQYLKEIDENIKLKWILHNDKAHGLEGIQIPDKTDLILLPDSSSNDFNYHKELKNKGIDVIVLDHHEVKKESEYAIVVNSQLCDYPNLNLSGAGITYKFCKALDEKLSFDLADNFLDLVALGCIADSMSMKELETRYYVQQGLNEINNEFLKSLLRKQEFSTKGKINIMSLSFYINPLINATIRLGTLEDKMDMFKSFIGEKKLVKYESAKSGEMMVSLFDDMARRCYNIRGKQARTVDKYVKKIEKHIKKNKLNKHKVICIYDIEDIESGLTGLIANKLASIYQKPVILLNREENNILKGSARGYDKSELKDFKSIVQKTKLFVYAEGHSNAFGVGIHRDKIALVNERLNILLQNINFTKSYKVDFKIDSKAFNSDLIYSICELEDVWGKDVDEPYLFVHDIEINKSQISLFGKNENIITIINNDNKFIMFNANRDLFEKINEYKKINIIGRANLNEYNGEIQPQIIIDDFELV